MALNPRGGGLLGGGGLLEVLEVFEVRLVMSSPDQESRTRCK